MLARSRSAAGCYYRDAIPDEHRRPPQVHNVADTLSVNHNWINACNVHWTYQLLRRDLADATAAIEGARTRQTHWVPTHVSNASVGCCCGGGEGRANGSHRGTVGVCVCVCVCVRRTDCRDICDDFDFDALCQRNLKVRVRPAPRVGSCVGSCVCSCVVA